MRMQLLSVLQSALEQSCQRRRTSVISPFLKYAKSHFRDVCDDVVESTFLDQRNQVLDFPCCLVVLHASTDESMSKILHLNRHSQIVHRLARGGVQEAIWAEILEIMWSSGHWPSPQKDLHPTCLMCGRLVCGPHKQMVQQLPSRPLRRLADESPVLKVNPDRLCRRISDPWMLEDAPVVRHCFWDPEDSESLRVSVKQVGYLSWDAVREHLESFSVQKTAEQCQSHWRELVNAEHDGTTQNTLRALENRSLGERWKRRDDSISAEMDAMMEETEVENVETDLGSGLILWCPLLACYLSPESSLARPPASLLPEQIQEDFLVGLSAFFRTPLVDRTGLLNQECSLRLAVLDPIPDMDEAFSKDLATIMDQRAESLLSLAAASNCKVEVLWSGGIDSTSLLIAFLRALQPHWRPGEGEGRCRGTLDPQGSDRMIVRCSADSIAEYPWFHEQVLLKLQGAGAIDLEPLADSEEVTALWEGPASRLTVTGECGDQIFGSQLLEAAFVKSELHAIYEQGLDAPWQETLLPCLLEMGVVRPDQKERWLAWFLPFVDRCPVKISTTFDLLWWLNLACKWQTVCLRLFQRSGAQRSSAELGDDFQQWSFRPEHHAAKMPDHQRWSSYKQPLKEYIFEYTQDTNYFEHKLKAGSLCQVNDASQFVIMGVDDQLNIIRFGETCLSKRQMERMYPNDGLRKAFWKSREIEAQAERVV
ncbi:Myb-like domain-containing protein [Durusdinium trenchii]|uniref:Myb-like domain-containing protein n=1 Tax=Durusdinium trenchii TaxID=1381693 RepID=A0ABP0SL89_9DINO